MELWLTILGYESYKISSHGRVRSFGLRGQGRLLKLTQNKRGYLVVGLYEIGQPKAKQFKVHQLVAKAFVEGYKPKLVPNHKDGIKTNNNVTNLEWVTMSQNIKHAYDIGLKQKFKALTISKDVRMEVRALRKEELFMHQIGTKLGISTCSVWRILHEPLEEILIRASKELEQEG